MVSKYIIYSISQRGYGLGRKHLPDRVTGRYCNHRLVAGDSRSALGKAKELASPLCMANDSSASKAWVSIKRFQGAMVLNEWVTFPQKGLGFVFWREKWHFRNDFTKTKLWYGKGALWEYMGSTKAYKCPADKRYKNSYKCNAIKFGGSERFR
jgi:hypothetical protein